MVTGNDGKFYPYLFGFEIVIALFTGPWSDFHWDGLHPRGGKNIEGASVQT